MRGDDDESPFRFRVVVRVAERRRDARRVVAVLGCVEVRAGLDQDLASLLRDDEAVLGLAGIERGRRNAVVIGRIRRSVRPVSSLAPGRAFQRG